MRNLLCLLPDGHVPVTVWAPHPCGGKYVIDAWVYGPHGRVGMWPGPRDHRVTFDEEDHA